MSNVMAFLILMLLSLGAVLFAGVREKDWLYACVAILLLASDVMAGKLIDIFGFSTSAATPLFAGIFLATDALSEFHGRQAALKAIGVGLFAHTLFVAAGQTIIGCAPVGDPAVSDALSTLFTFIPRLVVAGFFAFLVAQIVDVSIYHYVKDRTNDKHMWLRNNVSTIVAQLVDSAIVYTIAFYGMFPNISSLIITAWFFKIIVAVFDTPFLYAIRRIRTSE